MGRGIIWGLVAGSFLGIAAFATIFNLYLGKKPGEGFSFREPSAMISLEGLAGAKKRQSIEDLAKALDYPNEKKFKEEVPVFLERVRAGFATKEWMKECPKKYHNSLCSGLDTYLDPGSRMRAARKRSKRAKRYSIRVSNTKLLQKEPFFQLYARFRKIRSSAMVKFSKSALKIESCPRNLSITLALEWENHSFDKYKTMRQKLLKHGLECVKEKDPWAEFVHLRLGLTYYDRQEYKEALPLFQKAVRAETKKEEYRSLFYLFSTHRRLKDQQSALAVVKRLEEGFPMSWFSLRAQHEIGRDPLKNIMTRPEISDEYDTKDKQTDFYLNWLKAALLLDKDADNLRLFAEWVVLKMIQHKNLGVAQHMSRLLGDAGLYKLQIMSLAHSLRGNSDKFNYTHLKLLFPNPYADEIKKYSGNLDAAILMGLARQESGFDKLARSSANAKGLLQILYTTARGISRKTSRKDLYLPEKNIDLGSRYLRRRIRNMDGSVALALGAYNAGIGNVRKWKTSLGWTNSVDTFIDCIPFKETRDYIPSVLRNAYWYHRLDNTLWRDEREDWITSRYLKALLPIESSKARKEAKNSSFWGRDKASSNQP